MRSLFFLSVILIFVSISAAQNLTVDYSETLDQMVLAGDYNFYSDITPERFSLPAELIGKTVEIKIKFFTFNTSLSSDSIIVEMGKFGYRPATIAELLAYGKATPKMSSPCVVVALGSFCRFVEGNAVPYLRYSDYKSVLTLIWWDTFWAPSYNFLGVRE